MQSRKSNPKFLKSTKLAEPYQKLGMKTAVSQAQSKGFANKAK